MSDPNVPLLRHTVATVAYRAGKTLRDAPPTFELFKNSASSRSPVEILAHMGDLFDWAFSMAEGNPAWHNSKPLPWEQEIARFFKTLQAFDARLASAVALGARQKNCFRARLRIRSPTWGNLPCCAAWPMLP